MKKIFECLRRVRLTLLAKKENKRWLIFIESYCSNNSKYQWC
jgi:hypothetical protein